MKRLGLTEHYHAQYVENQAEKCIFVIFSSKETPNFSPASFANFVRAEQQFRPLSCASLLLQAISNMSQFRQMQRVDTLQRAHAAGTGATR